MKAFIIALVAAVLLTGAFLLGEERSKLWVSYQYKGGGDRVILIQDSETNARCYAITNNDNTGSGYAISCLPAK